MFIDNVFTNKIRQCESINQLIDLLKEKPTLILTFKNDINANISMSYKDPGAYNINRAYLDFFFYNQETLSDTEYEMLKFYCNTIFAKLQGDIVPDVMECDAALFLLLIEKTSLLTYGDKVLSESTKTFKGMQKALYYKILDLYVPCENPDEIVSEIMASGKSIVDFIKIAYNTKEFIEYINLGKTPVSPPLYPESLMLFKYLSDIYSNDDIKKETLNKYHYLMTKAYPLNDKIDELRERYSKYFTGSYLPELISEALLILYENKPHKTLSMFICEHRDEFTSTKVLELFIGDILEISSHYTHNNKHNANIEVFNNLSNVGLDKITCNVSPSTEAYLVTDEELGYVSEAYKKDSSTMHNSQHAIYKAYKNYKNAEDKIDSQISKAAKGMKEVLIGDVKTEVIEGKKFSAISILKKLLGTAAIFSFGPIQAIILLVVRYCLKKSTTIAEKKKIILELEAELEMINEKIDDARGDNNRQAKYSLMRTRTELNNALQRIKYGLEADERSVNTAKSTISTIRSKL